MFVAMFREVEIETGVRLYEAEEEDVSHERAPLPALALPDDPEKIPVVAWDKEAINHAVIQLRRGCESQGNVLGMDCEWEPSFDGSPETPVCTIQLALPDGATFLFHLQRGVIKTTTANFNGALKNLLEDAGIAKVIMQYAF